ncbi:hypothetical protein EXS71_01495 [Candidatus Uhrbacteria bacterium]|nr:hypothetical protein [Candidatus Uhrbacteria bacterium]
MNKNEKVIGIMKDNTHFRDDDFLNPSIKFEKYKGRDPALGKKEAAKRKQVFQEVKKISDKFAEEHDFEAPKLVLTGSTAVEMCTKKSDLDIAVVIKFGHKFIRNSALWHAYVKILKSIKTGFEIKPKLIIEGVGDTTAYLMQI